MKKSKLAAAALLAGMLVLPGCGEKEDSSESGSDEPAVCQHVDENKDHECDLCHENVGEHADHNNDHKCDYCEQKVSEHQYGEAVVTKDPTCTEDGGGYQECSICHDQKPVVIPATGHKGVTLHPAVAPTCTQDGNVAYYTCANEPGVFYQDEACTTKLNSIVDPKTGHSDVTSHPAVSPSCTEDGNVAYYTCANEPGVFYQDEACTTKLDSIVDPRTGHSDVTLHPAVSPSCTEDGNVAYYTCANEPGVYFEDEECTKKLSSIVDQKLGHDTTFHPGKPASFEEAGTLPYYTCSREEGKMFADEACTEEITSIVDPKKEHSFSDKYSSDDEYHWFACTDEGYESLKNNEERHIDYDDDFICDICEASIPGISGKIVSPVTYMGRGETLHLSSTVRSNKIDNENVTFKLTVIKGDSDVFELTDNYDGTADVVVSSSTSITECSAKIQLISVWGDKFLLDELTVFTSTYNSTKKNQITSYFGVDNYQIIPYFIGTSFSQSGTTFTQTSSNVNGHVSFEKVLGAFKNQGTWAVISESETEAVLTLQDPKDSGAYFKAVLTPNGTGTNVVYTKEVKQLTEFPTEVVEKTISGKTESKFVAPEDGTLFTYSDFSGLEITSNGSAEAYITKLGENGFYVVKSGVKTYCISKERTLTLVVTPATEGFTLEVKTQAGPTKTAWTTSDINKMTSLIGEQILFVANDYGAWSKYDDYLYTSSTKIEAELVAIETLDKASGYTKSIMDDGIYYTKDIDSVSEYSIAVKGQSLYVYLVAKEITSWLGADLASALSVSEDDIPAASGTSYMYSFGEETATVKVVGGELDAYKGSLEAAGYTIFEKRNAYGSIIGTFAVSSDRTIVIQLDSFDGGFELSFSKQSAITDLDWTEGDKEIMNEFMGELLPFVGGYAGKWYSFNGEVYATSTRKEAQYFAKQVFSNDKAFTLDSSSTEVNFVYKKPITKYENLVVTLTADGRITLTKETAKLATWEADDIADALGKEPQEALPAFQEDGATFTYTYGEDSATIAVFTASSDASMESYASTLKAAEFTSTDNLTFKSPTDTLTVVLNRVANKQFKIVATGHLPEGYSRVLPITQIVKDLRNDPALGDLPIPEGNMFFYKVNGECDITIKVEEGGSMSDFVTALGEKGFVLTDNSYVKDNLKVEVSADKGDIYYARLSLITIPAGAEWSDEAKAAIAELLKYKYWSTHTDLPCPIDATDIYIYNGDVTVDGADLNAYIVLLEQNGFYVEEEENWYGVYYAVYDSYEDYSDWGYAIYIYPDGSSFYFSTY